jgi:hypothetical protein
MFTSTVIIAGTIGLIGIWISGFILGYGCGRISRVERRGR